MKYPCFCTIIPPHILEEIVRNGSPDERTSAANTLAISARLQGQRDILQKILPMEAGPGIKQRTVYNARGLQYLPGSMVRREGERQTQDVAVNEAYDGAGLTYDLLNTAFRRNSLDGAGMRLTSSVHYGRRYNNAFWNGRQMAYGDGDGTLFSRFTGVLDIIGHELTHGLTQFTAGLEYASETGALNESFSDVFGAMVAQFAHKQTVDKASWIVGEGIFVRGVQGVGIRSMKAPGTAYDDPRLGKDPQPASMDDYIVTEDDNGGVHLNSGIPNHAFYVAATKLGGKSWETVGPVWFTCLTKHLTARSGFDDAANGTVLAARTLYGQGSKQEMAVREGWDAVKVPVQV